MSAETDIIPDWAVRAAQTAYETPVRDDASLVSLVPGYVSEDVFLCLAKSIHDAVMAEREKIVAGIAGRLDLDQTCCACPEQYNAKLDGAVVGYLRLRHGRFRVDYPECGEHEIYAAHPNGDGVFEDDERAGYLDAARRAIAEAIVNGPFADDPKAEG